LDKERRCYVYDGIIDAKGTLGVELDEEYENRKVAIDVVYTGLDYVDKNGDPQTVANFSLSYSATFELAVEHTSENAETRVTKLTGIKINGKSYSDLLITKGYAEDHSISTTIEYKGHTYKGPSYI